MGDLRLVQGLAIQGVVEQGRFAKLGSLHNDCIRLLLFNQADQVRSLGLPRIVFGAGVVSALRITLRQLVQRVVVNGYILGKPSPAAQEIVIKDVTASLLQSLDQAHGWKFTERTLKDHANPVFRPRRASGEFSKDF